MNKFKFYICCLLLIICSSEKGICQKAKTIPSTPLEEIDMMASMCGIALIYKDWQDNSGKSTSRGYNIGSVLIDFKGDTSVSYALNSVHCFNNGTQHGEVRMMQEYSFATKSYYLDSCVLYTSLEPCAMCAGMMCLEKVQRTVYAQHDPCYGGALQRLKLSSGGYPPYPNVTEPLNSKIDFYNRVDSAYFSFCTQNSCDSKGSCSCGCDIISFLISKPAKYLYGQEANKFINYKLVFPQNQNLYQALLLLYLFAPKWQNNCFNVAGPISEPQEIVIHELSEGVLKKAGSTLIIQGVKNVNKIKDLKKLKGDIK